MSAIVCSMICRYSTAFALCILLSSCQTSGDANGKAPTNTKPITAAPPPVEVPEEKAPIESATVSISSVVIAQDCPDIKSERPPKAVPKGDTAKSMPKSEPSRGAKQRQDRASRGRRAPGTRRSCTQSFLHLAFRGQGPAVGRVELKAVRLLSEKGEALQDLSPRHPSIWKDNQYLPWDETVPANGDLDASYKLSVPDWSALAGKLSAPGGGQMYRVEVDIEVDGTLSTIRSPQIERARPMNIRT